MARLIYITNCSLDGYIEDRRGSFDWTEPSEQLHRFINDLVRGAGIYLYGRRLYQSMAVWETDPSFAAISDYMREFAEIWQAAEKVVYSRTLDETVTQKTRLERVFDPQAIQDLKHSANKDILVGGANLASHAFEHGLVDSCQLIVLPVSVGGGKPAFPLDMRLNMELEDQRRFDNGSVFLSYRVKP